MHSFVDVRIVCQEFTEENEIQLTGELEFEIETTRYSVIQMIVTNFFWPVFPNFVKLPKLQ